MTTTDEANSIPNVGTKEGLTIDGDTQSVVPTPPKVDLATPVDVRREMAKVYRDMRSGRIDTQDGTRLAYVLTQIAKAMEIGELEQRVKALQRAIESRR